MLLFLPTFLSKVMCIKYVLKDFKYARLGEWRGFGFFLQNIIEYLIHPLFVYCNSCPISCKILFAQKYGFQNSKYARLRDWIGESERSCGRGFVTRRCYKIFAWLKRSKLGGLQCHTCRISTVTMWNFKTLTLPFFMTL